VFAKNNSRKYKKIRDFFIIYFLFWLINCLLSNDIPTAVNAVIIWNVKQEEMHNMAYAVRKAGHFNVEIKTK